MPSTFFVDSRDLANAISDLQCLDFSQLTRFIASRLQIKDTERALRKRVASALGAIAERQECIPAKAYAWAPHTHWDVLFNSGRHDVPPNGEQVTQVLAGQWLMTECTRPVDVYFDRHAAGRFELAGPESRRISARLLLSEYWLSQVNPSRHWVPPASRMKLLGRMIEV